MSSRQKNRVFPKKVLSFLIRAFLIIVSVEVIISEKNQKEK